MSHYTVAVITKRRAKEAVEEILFPYWEGRVVEPYLDKTKEELIKEGKEFKKNIEERINNNPGYEIDSFENQLLKAKSDEDFYKAMRDDKSYSYDEDGNQLTTYNPNSKWDWFSIGGRWDKLLYVDKDNKDTTKEASGIMGQLKGEVDQTVGGHPNLVRVNGAKIKDIKFDLMGGDYNKALREWELIVDKEEPKNDEEKEIVGNNYYKPDYFRDLYGSKEEYARQNSLFYTWALVDENGWAEQGKMGWFGFDNSTKESKDSFVDKFQEYIKDPENQDKYMFIVDCHI